MNKSLYLYLPVLGLAVLLSILVALASLGYKKQYINTEWVEFVEHVVDKRQEAVEELENYLKTQDPAYYTEYRIPKKRVDRHVQAIEKMMYDSTDWDKTQRVLIDEIGYDQETSSGLLWNVRIIRPLLGVKQDLEKWNEMIRHWQKINPIADSIRKVSTEADKQKNEKLIRLREKLETFKATSFKYDGEIQDAVQAASLELRMWSNRLTLTLALLLFLGGSVLIILMYRKADASQKQFRTLFENSPDGIAITDPEGKILGVNKSFEGLFGYTGREAMGRDLDDLLTRTEAEKKDAARITDEVRNKKILKEEVMRYNRDGEEVPVLLSAIPVEEDDEVTSLFAIYIDISRQKKLEEKNRKLLERERTLRDRAEKAREEFRTMFEEAPSAIALVEGPDYKYAYTNRMHKELTGRDAKGKTIEEAFPEFKTQGLLEILDHVYETGETHEAREEAIWIDHGDEKTKMYRDYIYKPLKDDDGNTYAIFIDSVDVTNKVEYRKQLQEELQEKTTLLAEIHHRVKNNLASITGILQLQLHHITDDQARQALIDSELRIHTLADIHELLYESERLSEIEMDHYIDKLVEHIGKVSGRDKPIQASIDVQPFTLNVQQAQPVGLMLNELIQNSYKHAFPDHEKGRIEVRGKLEDEMVHLEVKDNGVGITNEDLEKGGLGIDLIENITEQLQADLKIENQEGTCFSITFPKQ